jgi:hypothetical protein
MSDLNIKEAREAEYTSALGISESRIHDLAAELEQHARRNARLIEKVTD